MRSLTRLSTTLVPAVLNWSGYIQPTDDNPIPTQPMSALTAMRLLISILPAVLLALSMVVAWFYPITRERYAEIRQQLEEQRQTTKPLDA